MPLNLPDPDVELSKFRETLEVEFRKVWRSGKGRRWQGRTSAGATESGEPARPFHEPFSRSSEKQ